MLLKEQAMILTLVYLERTEVDGRNDTVEKVVDRGMS